MQSLGVMPLLAIRYNQVIAVSTRTRAATNEERNACQHRQLVIVSIVGLLVHHYDGTWDFFSIHGHCFLFFKPIAHFLEYVFVSLGTNKR